MGFEWQRLWHQDGSLMRLEEYVQWRSHGGKDGVRCAREANLSGGGCGVRDGLCTTGDDSACD